MPQSAITETRLKTHAARTSNINFQGYSIEQIPTESAWSGSLFHINNNTSRCRIDLQIYKKKEFKLTFIEIINPYGKNIIVGCIYTHLSMNQFEFNSVYLHELLQNLGNDIKQIVLICNFNIDMLKHYKNYDSVTFLDSTLFSPTQHLLPESHLAPEHQLTIYFRLVLTVKFLWAI